MGTVVARRSMVEALKGEELVNAGDSEGVGALKSHLAASGQRVGCVPDARPAGGHDRSSGHLPIMDEAGNCKVAASEGAGDQSHVSPDLRHTSRVAWVALKADAAAVRQRLEVVKGGVLIDTHGHVAAGLGLIEGAV